MSLVAADISEWNGAAQSVGSMPCTAPFRVKECASGARRAYRWRHFAAIVYAVTPRLRAKRPNGATLSSSSHLSVDVG